MDKIFNAKSIAIVGLSEKPHNIAGIILDNLIRWEYPGKIYGVNPKGGEVRGIKIYKTPADLPQKPDLVSIMVPASMVPGIMEEFGKMGVRHMVVPTGGFHEFDDSADSPAAKLKAVSQKYNIKFVGPNGLTIINAHNGLCLPFFPIGRLRPGSISILSQSGGVGLSLLAMLESENLGLSKFVSMGNKTSLSECDYLEYLINDDSTKQICMYLESISCGRRFAELAAKSEKPIIVYKSNTSVSAHTAAMSHTAAMTNDNSVVNAALKQSGVIHVDNLDKLITTAKAFNLPMPVGNRFVVISPAGGFTVIAADLCEKYILPLHPLDPNLLDKLATFGNAGVIKMDNPLDLGDVYNPAMVGETVKLVMSEDYIDGGVFIALRPGGTPAKDNVFSRLIYSDLSPLAKEIITVTKKPLCIAVKTPESTISKIKHNIDFPVFNSTDEAVESLAHLRNWKLSRNNQNILPLPGKTEPTNVFEDPFELLDAYNIKTAEHLYSADVNEIVSFADSCRYPVVLKTAEKSIVHKSDKGGVILDIKNRVELIELAGQMQKNIGKNMMVQKMYSGGVEVFIGGRRDPVFGPIVTVGSGGIFVELINDITIRLAPVNKTCAGEMIGQTRLPVLLKGFRGAPKADSNALVDAVVKVSELLSQNTNIEELDVNPLLVFTKGVVAVDSRHRYNT